MAIGDASAAAAAVGDVVLRLGRGDEGLASQTDRPRLIAIGLGCDSL